MELRCVYRHGVIGVLVVLLVAVVIAVVTTPLSVSSIGSVVETVVCVSVCVRVCGGLGVGVGRAVVGLKENPCGIAAWSVVVANYIFYVCASRAMTNCSPLNVLVGDIVDGPVSALVLPSTSAPVGRDLHSKQIDALVSG